MSDVVGLLGLLALVLLFRRGTASARVTAAPGSIEDLARQEAEAQGIPLWLMLATAQVESGVRQLPPSGSGRGKTFYPYGMTIYRARDFNPTASDEELEAILNDLQGQTVMAGEALAQIWNRYGSDTAEGGWGGDDERIRLAYVLPSVAKAGRPWPEMTGSVPTHRRLENWRRALRQWRAPVVG